MLTKRFGRGYGKSTNLTDEEAYVSTSLVTRLSNEASR